jgi:hypothetical protein
MLSPVNSGYVKLDILGQVRALYIRLFHVRTCYVRFSG